MQGDVLRRCSAIISLETWSAREDLTLLQPIFNSLEQLRPRAAALLLVVLTLALYLPGFASLPPMDRDEPRFAQASKQMLETGDVVAIRYQDEARNKKPVGIYWLQASAVALGEALGVPGARRTIWLYRLPSLLGALIAVLGTYWTALALTSRRAAFAAALLFAATIILTVESHLAKTDAVLCATVVIAMGALGRIYLQRAAQDSPSGTLRLAAIFWTAIGVGILIKGPITPMVPAFAVMVLSVKDRSASWLKALRPAYGLLWVLLLVLPWFVLILQRTHGNFLADSVGHDMLGKVGGAQESHGAPPGTYLAAFWVTAWPLAPFAALAAGSIWHRRREPGTAFLLAWLVPTWLLFELVATKLPHYVMPTYPAVAILAALGIEGAARKRPRWVAAVLFLLLALLPAAIPVVLVLGHGFLWEVLPGSVIVAGLVATALGVFCAWQAARALREGLLLPAALCAATAAFVLDLFVLGVLLTPQVSPDLALSGRLASAARSRMAPDCPEARFATAGDHEPSLVFLTGTDLLLTTGEGAAGFLKAGDCRAAFVEQRAEPAFKAALGNDPAVRLAERLQGTAINGGKHLDIGIYVRQRSQP